MNQRKPRRDDVLEAHLVGLDADGRRTGTAEHESGTFRVSVPGGAVPGARVSVRVSRRRGDRLQAHVLEVLDAGPQGARPWCPDFGVCGGCAFQDVGYAQQLEHKRASAADALRRFGLDAQLLAPVVPCPSPWRYRNKMDFTFGTRPWVADVAEAPDQPVTALGLHPRGRWGRILEVDECHIAFPEASPVLRTARRLARELALTAWDVGTHAGCLRFLVLRKAEASGELLAYLVTTDEDPAGVRAYLDELAAAHPELTTIQHGVRESTGQVALGEEDRVHKGGGVIRETLGGVTFDLSATSFFQTNTRQAERLIEVVRGALAPAGPDGSSGGGVLLDLYCGAGTFALTLADRFRDVRGFEVVESAVRDARANARRNGIENARFEQADVADVLSGPPDACPPADACVVDPPRAGLVPRALAGLIELAPPRIVYVSCNLGNGARDAAALVAAGWRLRAVTPVDLFPHTPHLEAVLVLERQP